MTNAQTLISKITILAMLVSMFAFVQPARAAALTDMSDTMTNQTVSETSDHTILFTIATTVAGGQTITVTFESDYSIAAALDFEDLDLSFQATPDGVCDTGDTEQTLVDSGATASQWNATRDSATLITFESGGASATIPAGAEVCVEIGTVAEEGSTGVEQVTNPSTAGSYTVSIGGSMTDSGTMATPIQDEDFVTVTAEVDPAITFDIDTSDATGGDTNAPYAVDLGTLTTGAVATTGVSGVEFIGMDLDTNASGGAVVTVLSTNDALQSTSVGTDEIDSTGGTATAGSEEYGICVHEVSTTSGTLTAANFDNDTLTASGGTDTSGTCDTTTHQLGTDLDGTVQDILNTGGAALSAGRAEVMVKASISGTTPAHNDYTDTLTFIATGTF